MCQDHNNWSRVKPPTVIGLLTAPTFSVSVTGWYRMHSIFLFNRFASMIACDCVDNNNDSPLDLGCVLSAPWKKSLYGVKDRRRILPLERPNNRCSALALASWASQSSYPSQISRLHQLTGSLMKTTRRFSLRWHGRFALYLFWILCSEHVQCHCAVLSGWVYLFALECSYPKVGDS